VNKKTKDFENEEIVEEEILQEEAVVSDAVDDAAEKLAQAEDKYLRLAAEYENFKRRSRQEKVTIYADAVADTVKEILPVLDSLDRAIATADADTDAVKADNSIKNGIEMIAKMTAAALQKIGVDRIEAVGASFDATLHEAVMHVQDDAYGENEVAEEFSAGYRYGDKVIRHSMVKVAN